MYLMYVPASDCHSLARTQALAAEGKLGTSDPSWMAPLALLARAYNIYILITGEDEMYRQQRPLPLCELYSPAAPQRGLLYLLKHALWQTLWVEGLPAGIAFQRISDLSIPFQALWHER